MWDKTKAKFKHATLYCNYGNGGLKSVDINSKIVGFQCSWVRRLCDDNFNQWKVIPSILYWNIYKKNFKFHSNLDLRKTLLRKLRKYYQEMLYGWWKFLSSSPNLPSAIISQFVWFDKKIQIDKMHIFFSSLSENGLNFIDQLFDRDGKLKTFECLKDEFSLTNNEKFKLFQIIHDLAKQ